MIDKTETLNAVVDAKRITQARLQTNPHYGPYIHANEQLNRMAALLAKTGVPVASEREFVNIGLMAVKELEASDPEFADALMLADYNFKEMT